MLRHSLRSVVLLGLIMLLLIPAGIRADVNDAYEAVTKAAIKKVAPSVVQIVTQGGASLVVTGPKGPAFRKALGPTTGVIVSDDGYIISSAFNFINKPSTILVEVSGRKARFIAQRIATDKSGLLTLLKIDGKGFPVPEVAPKKEIAVGHWSMALGRTLDTDQNNPPSVHSGIISALGRIWGKCLQTDANTSPVNYGGPLIDLQGRVQGIIIPASPRGTGETAGFEWYDSGIGFAVPMEDVMAVLPRLKKGNDLKRGLLGVRPKSRDIYGEQPVIGQVMPNSAAARAGLEKGDQITEIDGEKVVNMAQILHLLGPKYEGDKISLKVVRAGKEVTINNLELVGKLKVVANSFLGILPMRDDPKLGVEIRYVYPNSPAAKAGLKPGNRIVRYGLGTRLRGFRGNESGRAELASFLSSQQPGTQIKLEVLQGKEKKSISVALTDFPGTSMKDKDAPPEKLPPIATRKKAKEPLEKPNAKRPKIDKKPKKGVETGLLSKATANGNQEYWVYVHEDYDPNISQALLVWLHPPGKNKEADINEIATAWDAYCAEHNLLIVAPKTNSVNGWTPGDGQAVQTVIRDVSRKYTIDDQRIVAHGLGVGGQMAIYMAFSARDLIRGVATTGAVPTKIKDNIPAQRLAFFIVAGDRDPLAKAIAESRETLVERKIPVIHREIKGLGRQYLIQRTLEEMVRWIDTLDRM